MLTAAQLQTFKTDIATNTNTMLISGVSTPINAVSQNSADAQAVADWYNANASPSFYVWNTAVAVGDIFNQINWKNYTPAPAPDTTVQWSNCSLACQGKQFNLQNMLLGRTTFDASLPNLRSGLNDATTNLPAGTPLGTTVSGGWGNILPILYRLGSSLEKLFAVQTSGVGVTSTDPLGNSTNPGLMQMVGPISGVDVQAAWAGHY